eukprot:TRINITY_DN26191_c0_g1_i1.p1 TRINITY_DN26191_c0_g1~~TRINITY_DN26191_c0_g1_i1.p1  ORF type:complete len:268 (+),score=31.84 TRINITY_DN26191_c0_g1_i1:49-804(+)
MTTTKEVSYIVGDALKENKEFKFAKKFMKEVVKIDSKRLNPDYHAYYNENHQSIVKDRGNYLPPSNCAKFALQVGTLNEDWKTAFHGTSLKGAKGIIARNAILPAGTKGVKTVAGHIATNAIWCSQSHLYAGHPVYASPIQYKGKYVQLIVQLKVKGDTMLKHEGGGEYGITTRGWPSNLLLDPRIPNDQLAWWTKKPEDVVAYALLVFVSDKPPKSFYKELAKSRRKDKQFYISRHKKNLNYHFPPTVAT